MFKTLGDFGQKFFPKHLLIKHGLNISPMYRRSTGRIIEISEDLMRIRVKLAISWRNKNYANTIFGGSMFATVDPMPMVQLVNVLGPDFVVWDKSAQINFKRPAKEDLYATFEFTETEIAEIKNRVAREGEIEINKLTLLTNKDASQTYCEIDKRIYIADKAFYKQKIVDATQRQEAEQQS